MKMSDVFNLPMEIGSSKNDTGMACTELADNDFFLADFRRENSIEEAHNMAKAAAHAINSHDKLEADKAALVEALERMATDKNVTVYFARLATDALKKVKGDL